MMTAVFTDRCVCVLLAPCFLMCSFLWNSASFRATLNTETGKHDQKTKMCQTKTADAVFWLCSYGLISNIFQSEQTFEVL